MKTTAASARSLAAHAVARILREGVTLDAALKDALAAADPKLAPSVRSLSYGAVRGYYRHEAILRSVLSAPVKSLDLLVRALLSVALYELEDERTPEYAVVDAAVQTAKATDAARAAGLQAPMWLRVNSQRTTTGEYLEMLRVAGIGARAEARVPHAVALDLPRDVHDLPGFADGLISVQDLGAQCVTFPLGLAAGQRVLDACAAPGGKTALIAEREPQLSKLVAVDIDPQRLDGSRFAPV